MIGSKSENCYNLWGSKDLCLDYKSYKIVLSYI